MDDESQFCFDPEQLDRLLSLGTDGETSGTEKGKAEFQGTSGQNALSYMLLWNMTSLYLQ